MIWVLFRKYWEKLGNFLFHHLVTLGRRHKKAQKGDSIYFMQLAAVMFDPKCRKYRKREIRTQNEGFLAGG